MKKTIWIVCISLPAALLTLILLSYSTFCSRAKTLDEFRKDEDNREYYDGGVVVHTEEIDGNYWDFVINGDQLHVFRIRVDKEWGTNVYLLSTRTTGYFSESVNDKCAHYEKTGELKFNQETKLTMKLLHSNMNVYWCFMDDTPVDVQKDVKAYPFTYNNENYVLYIKQEEANS